MLKLQSGSNSLKKTSDDVHMAVQSIIQDIRDQGTAIEIQRIDNFMYQIQIPNVKQYQGEKFCIMKIKLSLSGGQLMVKTGGGFKLFLQWLGEKRVI